MSDGFIDIGSLPIESVVLDESLVYVVSLTKATLSPKIDTGGRMYCSLMTEVVQGDYEGKAVGTNWLPIPYPISDTASKKDRYKWQDTVNTFARFCRSFKIKDQMPEVDLIDPDSKQRWQDWIEKSYGNVGKVTIQNQEFPKGSGKLRSGINDYVL